MYSGIIIDDIIMNIFTQSTKNTTEAHQEQLFYISKDDEIQFYKGYIQDFTRKTTIDDTKTTLRYHHYIGIEIWRKYLNGITHIESTQAYLEKKVDDFINNKIDFYTTHIIKYDIQPVTNVPEEARLISSMTPTGFRNDQYESRCYVNLTFQVLFSIYIFRTLIMNIDCDIMLTNIDNIIDDYNGHIQKIMILQVIQQIFVKF